MEHVKNLESRTNTT